MFIGLKIEVELAEKAITITIILYSRLEQKKKLMSTRWDDDDDDNEEDTSSVLLKCLGNGYNGNGMEREREREVCRDN